MRVDTPNFSARNVARTKRPRFVVELAFDQANTVLKHFGSHDDIPFGYSLGTNGLNSYCEVPYSSGAFNYVGGDLSIECMVSLAPADTSGGHIFGRCWNGSAGGENYALIRSGANSLSVIVGGATSFTTAVTSVITVGVTHHVVLMLKSSKDIVLYVDGVEVGSGQHSIASWTPGGGNSNLGLILGAHFPFGAGYAGNTVAFSEQLIDAVRVYTRALSQSEVAAHMAGVFENESGLIGLWHFDEVGPLAIDGSGNMRHGTLVNSPARRAPLVSALFPSKIKNLSSSSQTLDPGKAVATIGKTSFELVDKGGCVTKELGDQLELGRSTRLQRSRVFMGYEGLVWEDYALLPMTQFVAGIAYHQGVYKFECTDIQREMRKEVFTELRTTLTAPLKSGDTTITVQSTAEFTLVEHGIGWGDAPEKTCLYVRVEDEVIRCTGIQDSTHLTIDPVGGRGVINTREVEHLIDTSASVDRRTAVTEHIYIELPALKFAYAVLTGQLYGQSFLSLPGQSGDYADTPNSAAISITGNIDVRIKAAPLDWTPSSVQCLIGKIQSTTLRSYWFELHTDGTLRLTTSPDGTSGAEVFGQSTAATGYVDGTSHWVRVTLNVNDGAGNRVYKFYTSEDYDPLTDSGTWTQLGSTVTTAGATTIHNNSSVLEVGSIFAGTSELLVGKIYYAELRNGIDGVRVVEFDPNRFVDAELTAVMSLGEVWVVHQSGTPKAEIVHRTLPTHWHLGISKQYVRVADFISKPDIWNVWDEEVSFPARSEGLQRQDGKRFIESQLMLLVGCFMNVYSDGALGCKRMVNILSGSAYVQMFDDQNLVGHGDPVKWDYGALHNVIDVDWNWDWLKRTYTRHRALVDLASIALWKVGSLLRHSFQTLHGNRHSEMTLKQQFNWMRDRYTSPPILTTARVLPSLNTLEVGDVVRLRDRSVRDFTAKVVNGVGVITATGRTLDRSFEIQGVTIDWVKGDVGVMLFGTSRAPEPLSPVADTTVLTSAFYTSKGVALGTVLTITGSNPGHVSASGNLVGHKDMQNAAAIYYYEGDLVFDQGVVVTINQNVQLRIRGQVTNNGFIDGKGRGLPGAVALTSGGLFDFSPGMPGFIGTTESGGSIRLNAQLLDASSSRGSSINGVNSSVPEFALVYDGATSLLGLPADLRGSSGSSGLPASIFLFNNEVSRVFGGKGGNGGAGLHITCKGFSQGPSGRVDISGGDGDLGSSVAWVGDLVLHAGSGAGGAAGGFLITLDGALVTVTDLTDAKFIAQNGKTPIVGTPLSDTTERILIGGHHTSFYVGTGDGTTFDLPGSLPGGNLSSLRVQNVPSLNTPVVDPLSPDFEVIMQEHMASNWFQRTNPKNASLFGCCWVEFLKSWCAVGNNVDGDGAAMSDAYIISALEPGEVWTERVNPQAVALLGVTASLSLVVAVGQVVSSTRAYIATSVDLVTWTQRLPLVDANLFLAGVVWFRKTRFVAVGGSVAGTTGYILTSEDGTTNYTARTCPVSLTLRAVACNGTTIIAVGGNASTSGAIVRSQDGISWTSINPPSADSYDSVHWLERQKLWVAGRSGTGSSTSAVIISKDDGLTWVEVANVGDLPSLSYIGGSQDILLTTPGGHTGLYTSRDGAAWPLRIAGGSGLIFNALHFAWSGHRFLAAGPDMGTNQTEAVLMTSLTR